MTSVSADHVSIDCAFLPGHRIHEPKRNDTRVYCNLKFRPGRCLSGLHKNSRAFFGCSGKVLHEIFGFSLSASSQASLLFPRNRPLTIDSSPSMGAVPDIRLRYPS